MSDALKIVDGGEVPAVQLKDTVLVTQKNAKSVDPVQFYGPNVK